MQVGVSTWFTAGPPPVIPFVDPCSIPGLTAWYDASDAATITKDGSNIVSQWNDKSGLGNNLVQNTAINRPLWSSNELNGLPAIVMSSTQRMITSTTFQLGRCTFFLLAMQGAQIGAFDGFFGAAFGNYYTSGSVVNWSWNGTTNNQGAIRNAPAPAMGKYIVMSGRRDANLNTAELDENGALLLKGGATLSPSGASNGRLGYDGNNNVSNLKVCEFIVYNGYLSDADKLNVENYLVAKWAPYVNFAERRALNDGVQRYCTANAISSVAGLPAPKSLYGIFGQSNAGGEAPVSALSPTLQAPLTNALIWNNTNLAWETIQAGVNNQWNSGTNKHGPEISFMYDIATDKGVSYLVKYAVGGTDLATRWRPDVPAGQNLYKVFIDRIAAARYAIGFATGLELIPDTFIWYQGEADASASYSPIYQANEAFLFNTIRNGIDIGKSQNLKIVSVRVNNSNYDTYYQAVNAAKVANAASLPNVTVVPGWTGTVDGVHADSPSQVATGNAAALVAGATTQAT